MAATALENIEAAILAATLALATNPNKPYSYSIDGQSVTRPNPQDALDSLLRARSILQGPVEVESYMI
jgi:hypothetical protein